MTSSDWHYGLPRTLDNIHRVASITRDRLSLEAWRTLNDFYASRRWRADAMPTAMGDSLRLLDDGLRVLAAFHGLTHENMTRNFGWSFLDMGRRMARAHRLVELLRGIFGKVRRRRGRIRQPAVHAGACRQLYHLSLALPAGADAAAVVRPAAGRREQSAQHRVPARGLARHIDTLPQSGEGGARVEEQRMALSLLTSVRLADVAALAKPRARTARARLAEATRRADRDPDRPVRRDRAPLLQSGREGRPSGCARARATSHDLRRQPPHHLRLRQAGAAIRAPRPHDAALGRRGRPCIATAC